MARGGSSHAALIQSIMVLSGPCHVPFTYSLIWFMQGIQKKPTEQDGQPIFTTRPCQHSWFLNKHGEINLLLAESTSAWFPILTGQPPELFKQTKKKKKWYLMKTNRCITAECHHKATDVCHHQVLIAELKTN